MRLVRILLVEEDLEVAQRVGRNAALLAAVVEVQRAAVRHEHPYDAPLKHGVEVSELRALLELQAGSGDGRTNQRRSDEREQRVHRALQQARRAPSMGPRSNGERCMGSEDA